MWPPPRPPGAIPATGSTAAATAPMPGADVGMEEVRRDPPFVSAVSTYDFGGHFVRRPFTARVLTEAELDDELAAAGLARTRYRNRAGRHRDAGGRGPRRRTAGA